MSVRQDRRVFSDEFKKQGDAALQLSLTLNTD